MKKLAICLQFNILYVENNVSNNKCIMNEYLMAFSGADILLKFL